MGKISLSRIFFIVSIFSLAVFESIFAQSIPNELLQNPNTPVITIGGFINFSGVVRAQNKEYAKERLPDAVLDGSKKLNIANQTDSINILGTKNRYSNPYDMVNDSEIYIKVGAISESGIKYGAIVELEADTSPNGRGNGFNADKSFIFTESLMGKFEFGNNFAANQKMKVGPSAFARAAGGINGKYLEHINISMLAHSSQVSSDNIACIGGAGVDEKGSADLTSCANVKLPRFIMIPQSPIAHGGYAKGFYNGSSSTNSDGNYNSDNVGAYGSFNSNSLVGGNNVTTGNLLVKNGSFGQMEDATKISYYTPRVNGWQVGASFTPDTGNVGTSAVVSGRNSGDIANVISWGLNYSDNIGNFGFAFSATGEHGVFEKTKLANSSTLNPNINRNRLESYDTGIMLTYFGFTLGGSYGYWGKSLQQKSGIYSCDYSNDSKIDKITDQICSTSSAKKFHAAQYYSYGAAYEFGPIAFSWTAMKSDFQKNKYTANSFGLDYKLAKGLMPYIELTKFRFQSNQPVVAGNKKKQIIDNSGYIVLTGILFSF